jgi:hypothetical protein
MTPENFLPSPEDELRSFEIFSPTQNNFETLPVEKLHELWRENHEKLKKILHDSNPPYFGLHGTSQENFQQIKARGSYSVEIATFYEKEYESEQFLYKLYQAALYVSMYANRKQPGRIMVFDLEKDGKNMTNPWERLKGGIIFSAQLLCDTDEEKKHLSDLQQKSKEDPYHNDLLFRSDLGLRDEGFNKRFSGSIDFSDGQLSKYVSNLEDIARIILRNRFLSQEIIAQTLKLIIKKRS